MNLLEKLAGQLIEPEDFKRDTLKQEYDILKKYSGLDQPPVEITPFHYKPKSKEKMFKLGKKHSKIYKDLKINLVNTHASTPATWPGMPITGGENERSFEKCLEIIKLSAGYCAALKEDYPNLTLTVHIYGASKKKNFAPEFIEEIRDFYEREKIKVFFEPVAITNLICGSYDDIIEEIIYHHRKREVVLDLDHKAGYFKPEEKIPEDEFKKKRDEGLSRLISILEKSDKIGLIHIAEPIGYDVHQFPNKEKLKPWLRIMKQPQVEYIVSECITPPVSSLKEAEKIERHNDHCMELSQLISFSGFLRKNGFKWFKGDYNIKSLAGFGYTKMILEELLAN